MGVINRGRVDDNKPSLKAAEVNGDAVVVTVRKAETPKTKYGQKVVCEFDEYPGYAFWLNMTMVDYSIARLGNDTDKWVGQRIPLEKIPVQNPQTKEDVICLYVMPPQEWDDAFTAYDAAKAKADKPAAKRSGGKRS